MQHNKNIRLQPHLARPQDMQFHESATPYAYYNIRPQKLPPIKGGVILSNRLAYTYLPYKTLMCTIPNNKVSGATKYL